MTYIPVGTILTYTASLNSNLLGGFGGAGSLPNLLVQFGNTLKTELPGAEEFDVEASHGSPSFAGPSQISLDILNNGVDHGSEIDCQAIFDGVLSNMGVSVVSSSITKIQLPNNPGDATVTTIATGAPSNLPPAPPVSPSVPFSLSNLFGTTGTLTSGFVILIVLVVALILLLPKGFGQAIRAVR